MAGLRGRYRFDEAVRLDSDGVLDLVRWAFNVFKRGQLVC